MAASLVPVRYFSTVLDAASLSNSPAITCLALPTWETALVSSRFVGMPTTTIATSAAKAFPAKVIRTAAVASIVLRIVVLHVFRHQGFRRQGRFDGRLRELADRLVAPAQIQ